MLWRPQKGLLFFCKFFFPKRYFAGSLKAFQSIRSGEWEKTKRKVSEKIAQLAQRLVHLYASREEHIGFAFSKDSELQKQFEQDFDYELTHDQARAVKEIMNTAHTATLRYVQPQSIPKTPIAQLTIRTQ